MRAIQVLPGVTHRRRLPQRVRGPRQPVRPDELHVRRRADVVPAPHRAAGPGRRLDRDAERRHPRRHHAAERLVPAALRQPARRASSTSTCARARAIARRSAFGVSGTDASVVVEGPLGGGKAGSWLVSARKSYLELLLKQIDDEDDFGFGFSDIQSKLVYDVVARAPRSSSASSRAGRVSIRRASRRRARTRSGDGRNSAVLVNAGWRFTLVAPRSSSPSTWRSGSNDYTNVNAAGGELDRGRGRDVTWRADFVAIRSSTLTFEGGAQVQWQHRDLTGRFLPDRAPAVTTESYDDDMTLASAYAQARWSPSARFTRHAGRASIDGSSSFDTTASPWVLAEVRLGSIASTARRRRHLIVRCPASRRPSACGRGRRSCPSAPPHRPRHRADGRRRCRAGR